MVGTLIGTRLDGRFRIEERFAGGASAWVYRAIDEQTGATRAVKVLVDAASPELQARFRAEMALLSRLHHPSIVPVHAVGVVEGLPYMVMDFVAGGSVLARRNEDGPLPLEDACVLAIQVLSALAEAHGNGIVHRDVKPGNVLVDEAGNAELCDFGIARHLDATRERLTSTGISLGTLLYMAPEQRLDAHRADLTVDLYGVGTLLFRLVTDANPADLFTADIGAKRWAALPEPLRPLVWRATRTEPRDRWPSARAMAEALLAQLSPARREALVSLPGGDPARFPAPAASVRPPEALPEFDEDDEKTDEIIRPGPPGRPGKPSGAPVPKAPTASSPWPWRLGGSAVALVLAGLVLAWLRA